MSSLSVEDLRFAYEPGGAAVIAALNLCLESGETGLILGDNGSGKTTLGKLLAGMLQPQRGAVLVDGQAVHKTRVAERPRRCIFLGQTSYLQFFRSSIADEISLACRLAGATQGEALEAYQAFGLPADHASKPMDLAYPEMWRFQLLLMAVIFSPSILFIDEVVAPGSSVQRQALDYVLQHRSRCGRITLVACQRDLSWFPHRNFLLEHGTLAADGSG